MGGRVGIVLYATMIACGFERVEATSCFVYVVASDSHTCGRKTDGSIWCWGNNQYGQLGTGDADTRWVPDEVRLDRTATGIYVPSGVDATSNRTAFTCARKTDGTLWCWGNNESGQLGTGDRDSRAVPEQIDPDGLGTTVHAAAMGSAFMCVRKTDNSAWCWGSNEAGQLGLGDTLPRLSPVQVETLGNDVRYVVAGALHACARKLDNTLWCWGSNAYGQLGIDRGTAQISLPTQIDPDGLGSSVDIVAAGATHTCAMKTDATLWCWGRNQYGQLGVGDRDSRDRPVQVPLTELAGGVPSLSAGTSHTCAIKADGSVACWGDNQSGQLGTGTRDATMSPVAVDATQMTAPVAVIYGGGTHTCARTADNGVWCWGNNQFGQLGLSSRQSSLVPAVVARCE